MARGSLKVFDDFALQLGQGQHDFLNDTLRLGFIDDTITPDVKDIAPTWDKYKNYEVSFAGGYISGGMILEFVIYEMLPKIVNGEKITTLKASNLFLPQNDAGFINASWGILYNDTNDTDIALAYICLGGPISEKDGPVEIVWNKSGILNLATVEK